MNNFKDYLQAISQINNLGNGLNVQWLFYCGMLFSSRKKWWGDWQYRPKPHEGIDICWFQDFPQQQIKCFDPLVKIPAMDKGRVLNICDDFLGKTIVVEHSCNTKYPIVFTYAHIIPVPGIENGCLVDKNQVIAKVCSTHKNPQLPPHLHFSCFEITTPVDSNCLDWHLFTDSKKVNMIHPLFL